MRPSQPSGDGWRVCCEWGDFFEGCEVRREEAPDPTGGERASIHFGEARQAAGRWLKRGEPRPVPGCNKPGTPVSRKPSRW
jgi:hypothetical protein